MRATYTRFGVMAALVAAPLFLTGCTTVTEQEVAAVRDTANAAKAEADRAMSTAEQALQVANKAAADAAAANEKIDRMYQRGLRK
jgi:Alanine-zipper, major outer membrane lipoprotein